MPRLFFQTLEMQRQAGMDVFTDGEYRRTEFRSVFADAVGGLLEILPEQQRRKLELVVRCAEEIWGGV